MSGEERSRGPSRRDTIALALLVAVAALLLYHRGSVEPQLADGVLVEVVGDVRRPGVHLIDPPTVASAVAAARGPRAGVSDEAIPGGVRVVVDGRVARVTPAEDPLLLGHRVDLNTSGRMALVALHGVGPGTAAAILEDRARRGPFYAEADLLRVRGVGPATLESLSPFITVGDVGPRPPRRPLDLNEATAPQLQRVHGVGPVTAAAIVADRDARGPFESVEDLIRVRGVGPKTVEKAKGVMGVTPSP
jgi:competence protein ComEA